MCLRGRKKKQESGVETAKSIEEIDPCELAKQVEITPERVPFFCGNAGKPTAWPVSITNKSPKTAAYKILSSDAAIFSAEPSFGIVRAGQKEVVEMQYRNQQEQTSQHYFRVFIALIDTDVLPEEFQGEAPPTQYHGGRELPVVFSMNRPLTRFEIRPIPDKVEVSPETLTFNCGSIGTRAMQCIQISNRSEKHAAYKVIPTLRKAFSVVSAAGIVHSGTSKPLPVTFKNEEEPGPKQCFLVFVSLLEGKTLPEEFQKTNTLPPKDYDGVKVLPIVFTSATEETTTADTSSHTPTTATTEEGTAPSGTPSASDASAAALTDAGRPKKKDESKEWTNESLESEGYTEIRLISTDVVFTPPLGTPLKFDCFFPGKPVDAPVTLANKSAKLAAYKVWSTDQTIFKPYAPCGIVPAGETKTINIQYLFATKLTQGHYFRIFVAFLDTEVLPEEFQAEKTDPPLTYDGEHFLIAAFNFDRKVPITPLPNEVVILPSTINFKCKTSVAEPSHAGIKIQNNHPEKKLAYKVITTNRKLFKVRDRAAVLLPGKWGGPIISFANQKEEKGQHNVFVFVALIDSIELPEDFKKRKRIPPLVYDGAKVLPMTFSKDTGGASAPAPAPAASAEATKDGPPSQTGAPTVTDADAGTPVAPPAAAEPTAAEA